MPEKNAVSPPEAVDLLQASDAEFVAAFDKLYTLTWGTAAIPAKYKELTGVTLSIANRCDPCLVYHIRMALAAGATKGEFVDSIRLAILSAGSITIPTARYAYRLLREQGVL
jgi:AhpD family alkylhydroperoxidase